LGTEFNALARSRETIAEIILDKGSIAVQAAKYRTEMEPGDKLTIDKANGYAIELTRATEVERMRVGGRGLTIENVSAREALNITAEYFGMTLDVEPGTPGGDSLTLITSGTLSAEEIVNAVDKLSDRVTCRIEGNTIVVTKK
jgi:hypothetical protein